MGNQPGSIVLNRKPSKGVSEKSDECDYREAKDKRVEIEESWGIAQLLNNMSQLSHGCFLQVLVSKCESYWIQV